MFSMHKLLSIATLLLILFLGNVTTVEGKKKKTKGKSTLRGKTNTTTVNKTVDTNTTTEGQEATNTDDSPSVNSNSTAEVEDADIEDGKAFADNEDGNEVELSPAEEPPPSLDDSPTTGEANSTDDYTFKETQNVNVEGLPFGDINVLLVTDVHSHIGGHKHEENRDADYGNILSFYEHLKHFCDENGHDLWFINNGNWKDGTGLAMGGNSSSLVPLLNKMPWDAINIGEHELYHQKTVDLMKEAMIPNFANQFVSSNVNLVGKDGTQSMVKRHILLEGQKYKVLVFGFIHDLYLPNPRLKIESVENTVKEVWFEKVLQEETYDAILVLAQIDAEDGLINIIHDKIRAIGVGDDVPIQFIAGHTQKRAHKRVGTWSHSFQAGANLDTLGFVSFPVSETAKAKPTEADKLFEYAYLNTSVHSLTHILGNPETFQTERGQNMSQSIQHTRHFLGLDEVVACPVQDYHLENHIFRKQSLWWLWQNGIVPNEICKHKTHCIVLVSSSSFRYGVRGSATAGDEMTLDDIVAIAPLLEPVYHLGKINDYAIRRLNSSLNIDSNNHHHTLPTYVMAGVLDEIADYDLYTHGRDLKYILPELERLFVKDVEPKNTGDKDTLYWLRFAQNTWICPGVQKNKKNQPWFQTEKALELERDDVIDLDDEDVDEEEEEWVLPDDSVYYGYNPTGEHAIKLPGKGGGKQSNGPTSAQLLQQRAEAVKNRREKNAKTRKEVLNIAGMIFGVIVLCVPLYYIGRTIVGVEEEKENFYDPKELAAFKKIKKNKMKPMEMTIELT